MDIKRGGSQPSGKGSAEWFTGAVRIDPLHEAPDPARVRAASVTFEPGARTAWHTSPAGANADRDGGLRQGAALGWRHRGNSSRRCGLDSAGGEALARCSADHGRDAHRHSRTS